MDEGLQQKQGSCKVGFKFQLHQTYISFSVAHIVHEQPTLIVLQSPVDN